MNEYAYYWFDHLFDADNQGKGVHYISRATITIEDLFRMQFNEDELARQPQTFDEAYREKHLTALPF